MPLFLVTTGVQKGALLGAEVILLGICDGEVLGAEVILLGICDGEVLVGAELEFSNSISVKDGCFFSWTLIGWTLGCLLG